MILQLLRLARPWHWIKNSFILVPVPFALSVGEQLDVPTFALGFVGFCLINSAVYVFNDLRDAEADRLNPRKANRPIASKEVSISLASAWSITLGAAGFLLCAMTEATTILLLTSIYLGANILYSMGAKNIPVLDVFILASGYIIRILIGCALIDAEPSSWLLLCSSMLALFLAFAKRRSDIVDGMTTEHRKSLSGYNLAFLDQAVGISAGITLLSYALYSQETSSAFVPGRELAGLPFVAFGIFDYLRRIYTENAGGSPVEIAYRSRTLQACVFGWVMVNAWGLGLID